MAKISKEEELEQQSMQRIMRQMCLQMAVQTAGVNNHHDVLDAAKAYVSFVNGDVQQEVSDAS